MRVIAVGLVVPALFASGVFGQTASQNQVVQFKQAETAQNFREVATLIRTIADLPQASVDNEQGSLSLGGSAEQVKLAQWLFNEVDVPLTGQPSAQQSNLAGPEYRLSGSIENVVQVFYLTETETVQSFQEVATLIRTIADIRRAFTYNAPRVLAVRGTPEQVALAGWLVNAMNRSVDARSATQLNGSALILQYPLPLGGDHGGSDFVRVFRVAHAETVQGLQEVATAVRMMGDIRRVFTSSAPRVITIRGPAEQIGLAEWLFKQLDKPVNNAEGLSSAAYEYQAPNERDSMVKVFYFPPTETVQDFQKIATQFRTTASVRRVFTFNAQRAIALRGTSDQIAQAERLAREQNKPALSKQ